MKKKQNIPCQENHAEKMSPFFEKMKQEGTGFKVPDGYFDTLSPRIVDSLQKQENRSLANFVLFSIRKPLVWAPITATALVAAILIFVVPAKNTPTIEVADEWTELNMAYDASYAEEVMLAESIIVDSELEQTDLNYIETASFSTLTEPTDEEIAKFLDEQEIDTDILIEN
jgi:hypothetical protein